LKEDQIEIVTDNNIKDGCIKKIAQDSKIVLDLGEKKPFDKNLSKHRERFVGISYFCMDICPHPKLHVIGDIQCLPFKSESADAVICNAVLEHVFEPQTAVREIHRVLNREGKAFVYIPFLYPYHGTPDVPDCYRFTKDALMYMFREFREMKVQPLDGYIGTTVRFLMGFGKLSKRLLRIEKFLERIIKMVRGRKTDWMKNASGFNLLVKK
jgi:SAM-dependent methyltransferase